MAKEKKKIVLTSLSKSVTQDNFKEGQNPDTSRDVMYEKNLGSFDTGEEVIEFLNKQYGLSDDKNNYTAFEDGRISYQQLEDGDGNVVEDKDAIFKKFKKGEVDLWAADYDIYIELAEVKTPSVKEISKLFKIKEYAKGGKLERYFGKAKDYANKAVKGVQKGYGKAKDYTNKKIHDQKKKVALEVIDDTKDKVEVKQKMVLKGAEELVSEEYGKGGLFDDDREKSAIARDRKYQSNEPHEKSYKRKSFPKHPHYKTKAEGGKIVTNIDEETGSDELKEKIQKKVKKDETIIHFGYSDYGGQFFDKVAIEYFKENHPKNTISENTGYNGQVAFVFGKPAEEFVEESKDGNILGYETLQDTYSEMEREAEEKSFKFFLDDIKDKYTVKKGALDKLEEERSGYYSIMSDGQLDFSYSELTSFLEKEGLIVKNKESGGEIDDEYSKGGGIRTSNSGSSQYTNNRQDFKANNLEGKTLDNGVYVVLSYGYYPVYVWKKDKWYGNNNKYSVSTAKQMTQSRPSGEIEYVDTEKLKKLAGVSSFKEGGKINYEDFKEGMKVKTTIFMSTEDIGGDEDIEVGTIGVVDSEPNDDEQLVDVIINGTLHRLPQDVLEIADEKMEKGGKVKGIWDFLNEKKSFWQLFE